MPEINLDQIITIDNTPDPNEVEEMESIAEQLYSLLQKRPHRFNDYNTRFIEDMFRLDAGGYSLKQINYLYQLDRRYLR
jgi:hypothetical protein